MAKDLAAQISFYRGDAELLQPTGLAVGAKFGANVPGIGYRWVADAVAKAVLGMPAFKRGKKDLHESYSGQFVAMKFDVTGFDNIEASLRRAEYIGKSSALIDGKIKLGLLNAMQWIIADIRDMAAEVVQKRVYETPAMTRHHKETASQYTFEVFQGESDGRTYNLMAAVQEGIQLVGNQIVVGIDAELAPYWRFVEAGHYVVLPGGLHTGGFVLPRPFFEEIKETANAMLIKWWAGLPADWSLAQEIIWSYVVQGPQGFSKYPVPFDLTTAFGVAQKAFEGIDVSAGIKAV